MISTSEKFTSKSKTKIISSGILLVLIGPFIFLFVNGCNGVIPLLVNASRKRCEELPIRKPIAMFVLKIARIMVNKIINNNE